jgi:VWFA-related protein
VKGLTKDDFTVLEDGQPQVVVGFEAREAPSTAAVDVTVDAPPAGATNRRPKEQRGRSLAFVIDDLGISISGMTTARKALSSWLETKADPRDEVTLLTTSGDLWWSDRVGRGREDLRFVLGRAQGRRRDGIGLEQMSEWEALEIDRGNPGAIKRVVDRWIATGACSVDDGPGRAAMLAFCAHNVEGVARNLRSAIPLHSGSVFEAIARVSQALAGGSARKSIVLLSEGFVRDPEETREAMAIDAARRANTAVYFVNTSGLVALTTPFQAAASGRPPNPNDVGAMIFEQTVLASGGSENLAEETGGTAFSNNNDLLAGLDRAAEESTTYYLLGYQPTKPASAKWRKLEVRVARPGLKVRARLGYYPTLPPEPARKARSDKSEARDKPKDKGLDPALLASGDRADIPLRLVPYVFDSPAKGLARVIAVLDVDSSVLTAGAAAAGAKITFELLLVGVSRADGQVYRVHDLVEATVRPNAKEPWWTFSRELRLPAGISQVRALVRQVGTSRTGSVTDRLEVPKLDAPYLSTPILSDRLEPTGDHGRRAPVLQARSGFPAEGRLYCQYEVFGARGGQVAGSYALRRADGTLVREAPPTPISRGPDGRVIRTLGIGLAGLPEGDYELALGVSGDATGALEARERFTLFRPQVPEAAQVPVPEADPRLVSVLARAGSYALEFERQFRDLVVEETYKQWVTGQGGVRQRVTRGDLVYVAVPGPLAWTCFRDVMEVDGKTVSAEQGRLERLFTSRPASDAIAQANAILAASAAWNIGAHRTLNVPTLGLALLRPDTQARLQFRWKGEDQRAGRKAIVVEFVEPGPALVHSASGEGLPAEGRLWIDPAGGALVASEIVFRFPGTTASARLAVDFALEPRLRLWVPDRMNELYADALSLVTSQDFRSVQRQQVASVFGDTTRAEARYSQYRRFSVNTREEINPASP